MKYKKLFESVLLIFKEKTSKDLRKKYKKLDVFTKINTIKFVPFDIRNEVKSKDYFKDNIHSIFEESPLKVINELIKFINRYKVSYPAVLNPINEFVDYRDSRTFYFKENFKIEDYCNITSVENINFIIYDENKQDITSSAVRLSCQIESFNYIDNELYISGEYELKEPIHNIFVLDYLDINAEITFNGISEDLIIPTWLEYIIDGCVYFNAGNKKMAIFNIFAGMDKFIELLYDYTFMYYLENYNNLKKYIAKCIDIYLDKNDEHCGVIHQYKKNLQADLENYLVRKIKNYSKEGRRLVNEKYCDVIKEVNITTNTGFQDMYNLISKLRIIEDHRNAIGHGEEFIDSDVEDIIYTVVTLIASTIINKDLDKTMWSYYLK